MWPKAEKFRLKTSTHIYETEMYELLEEIIERLDALEDTTEVGEPMLIWNGKDWVVWQQK